MISPKPGATGCACLSAELDSPAPMPTALDNGRRSPRKLLRGVVARLLGGLEPGPLGHEHEWWDGRPTLGPARLKRDEARRRNSRCPHPRGPIVVFGYLFIWAARKDGKEDQALQRRLGIPPKPRLGR